MNFRAKKRMRKVTDASQFLRKNYNAVRNRSGIEFCLSVISLAFSDRRKRPSGQNTENVFAESLEQK